MKNKYIPSKQSMNKTGCELMNRIKEKFTVTKRNTTKRVDQTTIYNRNSDRLMVDALIEALHNRVMADNETLNISQVFSRAIVKDGMDDTAEEGLAIDVAKARLGPAAASPARQIHNDAAKEVRSEKCRGSKPADRVDVNVSIRVENLDRLKQPLDLFLTRFLVMVGKLDKRSGLADVLGLIESYPSSVNVTIVQDKAKCPYEKLDDHTLLQSIVHRLRYMREHDINNTDSTNITTVNNNNKIL